MHGSTATGTLWALRGAEVPEGQLELESEVDRVQLRDGAVAYG